MEKPYVKNLAQGIDIEFGYNKLFSDIRPTKIIVYKNEYSNYPKSEFIIKEVMKKFGFSISYSEFDNKNATYESNIISCLTSKK